MYTCSLGGVEKAASRLYTCIPALLEVLYAGLGPRCQYGSSEGQYTNSEKQYIDFHKTWRDNALVGLIPVRVGEGGWRRGLCQ